MRFLIGETADFCSTAWRIFSYTRGTPTSTVGQISLHGLRQLVELRAIGHLRARHVHYVVQRTRRNVGQGQKRDAGIGGVEAEIGRRIILVGGNIAVGRAPRLWVLRSSPTYRSAWPGRWVGLRDECIEHRIALGPTRIRSGDDRTECDRSFRRSGRIHNDDALQRSLSANDAQFLKLLPGRNHGNPAVGVLHERCHLFAGQCGVRWERWPRRWRARQSPQLPTPSGFRRSSAMRSPFCTPQLRKASSESADPLVHLIG